MSRIILKLSGEALAGELDGKSDAELAALMKE